MFTPRRMLLCISLIFLAGTTAVSLAQSETKPADAAPDAPKAPAAEPAPAAPAAEPAALPPAAPGTLAHVETKGSGPVVMVLVPGLTCDWTVWDAFMERNKDKYTMHAVTLPGFGGSAGPAKPETTAGTPWLDNAVAALANLVEEKKLEKPVIVGHSLGGLLAYRMAIEHGDKLGGVVAVDGFPAFPLGPTPIPKEQRVQMVEQMVGPQLLSATPEMWSQQIEAMAKSMVKDEKRGEALLEIFKKSSRESGARYMFELLKSDCSDKLAEAKCPYIAVAALNDDNAQMGMGKDGMKAIWTTSMGKAADTVVFVEDSRHFIMDDQPKALDEAVAAFVENKVAKKQ